MSTSNVQQLNTKPLVELKNLSISFGGIKSKYYLVHTQEILVKFTLMARRPPSITQEMPKPMV